MSTAVDIAGVDVEPGMRRRLELPIARLPTDNWLTMPVEVVNGLQDGPRLWLSAAIHGDEILGVEIIRQVLDLLDPANLRGTVLAVPIVNVFGIIEHRRYLPDGRDLNRCFPGSPRGSLASRLAHLFMTEIVARSTHGIDLHTGSNHRTNLPQIRGDLEHAETRRCAEAFATPVMLHAKTRDGSLRQAAAMRDVPVLVYEAGEPLRFNDEGVQLGVHGTLRVMEALGMRPAGDTPPAGKSRALKRTTWVRARRSGILRLQAGLGDRVKAKQVLGVVSDAFGGGIVEVRAPRAGLVIGHTNNPLVNQGDGVVHIADEAL